MKDLNEKELVEVSGGNIFHDAGNAVGEWWGETVGRIRFRLKATGSLWYE